MTNDRFNDRENEQDAMLPESERPIVYVRPVAKEDIPNSASLTSDGPFYAVHDEAGRPLALFDDRNAAFILARSQNMRPVSVH